MRTAGREAERCAWHPSLLPLLPEDFSFSLQGRHLATQFTPLLIFLRTQALASWAALGRRWGGGDRQPWRPEQAEALESKEGDSL